MVYRDYKNYALGLQGLQGLQRQILRLHCDYKKNLWDYNKITKKKREDYKKITKKSVGIIIHYRQWIGHICSPAPRGPVALCKCNAPRKYGTQHETQYGTL